jgi:hypothetical protein
VVIGESVVEAKWVLVRGVDCLCACWTARERYQGVRQYGARGTEYGSGLYSILGVDTCGARGTCGQGRECERSRLFGVILLHNEHLPKY